MFGQDIVVGGWQLAIKRNLTLRKFGRFLAKNVNNQKSQAHFKAGIHLIDECRQEGKDHLRKRGG